MMEVERQSEDGLAREVWYVRISTPYAYGVVNAVVCGYDREKRASKRHKFKPDPAYHLDKFDRRRNGVAPKDVPLPEDVIAEIKQRVTVVVHRPEADRRGLL